MATDPTPLRSLRTRKGRRRWVTTWYDDAGERRAKTFGYVDEVPRPLARRRWEAWKLGQWDHRPDVQNPAADVFTVARLAWRYLLHAHRTYRKRGKATSHVVNIRLAMRALRDAHGAEPAAALDAPKLARLRDRMVAGAAGGPRAASTVNDRLSIIQAAYKWARERGLVPAPTVADLLTVGRVRPGRGGAKKRRKVTAVDRATVDATRAKMPPVLADLVEVLWLTGMRPGEACAMRGRDVEAGGAVWFYRPPADWYKLEHLAAAEEEGTRLIPLGPLAQAALRPHLTADTSAPLFSPAAAYRERLAARRRGRKTPLYPSHARKAKADPLAGRGGHYTSETLRRAVAYACRLAGVPKWTPNQLRHAAATRLRKSYGVDGARVVLGHTTAGTTEIYLDPDVQLAVRIAREVG